jgi:glyoxylase-like metal-dependent hydrolase (beta-lactamase superfamily II)
MEIKEIKGNTFCIDTGMSYIPFYKINNEEIIMLDSGWAEGEQKGIDELLEKDNFKVAGIICSHAHIDHIGNNTHLKNKYNCVIAMPAYEALVCSSIVNLKVYYRIQNLSDVTKNFSHLVCKTDIMISDDQEKVCVCGIEFKIIHTPGHTPEHICIVTPDDVAYLGDAMISYEVIEGAKMPYAFILSEDLKSKEKLYDLNCSKYVVAHKGIYDDITNLIEDNIEFFKSIAFRVYDVIEGNMIAEDIFKSVIDNFQISINNIYKYSVIERMTRSYLEYLNETGMIDTFVEDGYLKYKKVV